MFSNRVMAEVKHNPTGTIVCKAQGEWNGTLEFTYSSGETKVIDTSKLPVIKKKIRPLEKQGQYESRLGDVFMNLASVMTMWWLTREVIMRINLIFFEDISKKVFFVLFLSNIHIYFHL